MASPPTRGQSAAAKAACKGAISYGQGPLQGGDWMLPGPARRRLPAGTTTCNAVPTRVVGCRAPARSGRQRPASKGQPLAVNP
ncbi:hypothetical protein BHM03_00051669 [Ensete ventricosum]|nr:hypothetical protein BHM03_00051669 [Ensete ventricosum]